MLCPNCETENNDDALFCDECGFPLSGSIARAGGSASPSRASSVATRRARAQRTSLQSGPDEAVYDSLGTSSQEEGDSFGAQGRTAYQWPDEIGSQGSSPLNDDPFSGKGAFDPLDIFDPLQEPESTFTGNSGVFDVLEEQDDESSYATFDEQASYDDFFADDVAYGGVGSDFEMSAPIESTLDFGDDFWRDDSTVKMPHVENDRAQVKRTAYRASQKERKPLGKGKLAGIIIAAIVVVAAIVAFAGFALGLWGGKAVPDVTGMTEADARSALQSEGFTVKSMQVKSDETEGLVLITDPGAGSHAPEGSEVIIHIATARFIPDIEGKTREEAAQLLKEAGYENVKYEAQYTSGEEGIVVAVSPEAGTRAKGTLEVIVRVSESYKVPDISGKDLDGAIKTIEDAGLSAEIAYIDTDQYADGTVMGTEPDVGTKVNEGDTVTINVSRTRGIELVGLTEELFKVGNTVTIGGVDWQIDSLMSVSYQGDDTVSYTATGVPFVSVAGQTLYGSSSTISGQVVWSPDNEVVSIG